jgi:hypothetical protein
LKDEHQIDLVYIEGSSRGWGPIEHLASLAERLVGMNYRRVSRPDVSKPSRLWHALRPVGKGRNPGALYLVKSPADISVLAGLEDFADAKQFRALWIVDSFRTEWAPSRRFMRHFDLVIYMQKGEAAFYETLAPGRTLYLPWGADVLDLGSAARERPIDVLRVGRQPEAWDDDARSWAVCDAAGFRFSGRPPFVEASSDDPSAGHRELCGYYASAKFVIAHSNLAAPSSYTHPEKEYLTGRWTDALAAGSTVAGVQPYGDRSSEDLLWPGATLDFTEIDLKRNVEVLAEAVRAWKPDVASANHREALKRLDWRWRLKSFAEAIGVRAPKLDQEILRLKQAIEDNT